MKTPSNYANKWKRYCRVWDDGHEKHTLAPSAREMLFAHCVKMDREIDELRKELSKTRGELTREKRKNNDKQTN